jgi:hypothetical protein
MLLKEHTVEAEIQYFVFRFYGIVHAVVCMDHHPNQVCQPIMMSGWCLKYHLLYLKNYYLFYLLGAVACNVMIDRL